jgi:hypothetical protein
VSRGQPGQGVVRTGGGKRKLARGPARTHRSEFQSQTGGLFTSWLTEEERLNNPQPLDKQVPSHIPGNMVNDYPGDL